MRDVKFAKRGERLCQSLRAGFGGGRLVVVVRGSRVATAAFRMGRRFPLRGCGGGVTWGCQGAWQVETRRPVTGGEHGSVREDRSEGMEGGSRGVR